MPQEADETILGIGRRDREREPPSRRGERDHSLVFSRGFAIQGLDEERLSQIDASSISRMSISLAAMGVRAPWKTALLMLGVVFGFVAVGAGSMFVTVWLTMPEPIAVASVPEPRDEAIFLGLIVLGLDEVDEAAPAMEPVIETAEPDEPPSATPPRPAKRAAKLPARPEAESNAPRSSSTTIEAPPAPGSGGTSEPPPSTGGGDSSMERVETMDEYSARVRGLVQVFYAPDAQRCFPQGARGTVVVRFTINPDGTVRNPSVARDTTGNPRIGDCMVTQIGQWRLSQPPRGQPTVFALTFAQ